MSSLLRGVKIKVEQSFVHILAALNCCQYIKTLDNLQKEEELLAVKISENTVFAFLHLDEEFLSKLSYFEGRNLNQIKKSDLKR